MRELVIVGLEVGESVRVGECVGITVSVVVSV